MGNVIVAGGATGIGRAAVRGFRARGDNVLLVDHRPQAADLGDGAGAGRDSLHPARSLGAQRAGRDRERGRSSEFGSPDTVLITAALMLSAPLSEWTQDMWDRPSRSICACRSSSRRPPRLISRSRTTPA